MAASTFDIDISSDLTGLNLNYDKSITGVSEKYITCVDTPGQDFFYRMRNYGASVADVAVLVVAADSGVCDQTQESIGIVEGLNIPVVVAINKIDLYVDDPSKLKNRLIELEHGIRQFNVLSDSSIVPVSAKYGSNINQLKQVIFQTISKLWDINRSGTYHMHWPSISSLLTYLSMPLLQRRQSELLSGSEEVPLNTVKSASGVGTTLNLWKNARDGTALHVVVNTGYVAVGDYFFSGGWSGLVKRIYLSSTLAVAETGHESSAKDLKLSSPLLTLTHAVSGVGVKLIVELHGKVRCL